MGTVKVCEFCESGWVLLGIVRVGGIIYVLFYLQAQTFIFFIFKFGFSSPLFYNATIIFMKQRASPGQRTAQVPGDINYLLAG